MGFYNDQRSAKLSNIVQSANDFKVIKCAKLFKVFNVFHICLKILKVAQRQILQPNIDRKVKGVVQVVGSWSSSRRQDVDVMVMYVLQCHWQTWMMQGGSSVFNRHINCYTSSRHCRSLQFFVQP